MTEANVDDHGPVALRDRYNACIERHDLAWELVFAFVAVVFVALGFLIDQEPAGSRPELEAVEWALTSWQPQPLNMGRRPGAGFKGPG